LGHKLPINKSSCHAILISLPTDNEERSIFLGRAGVRKKAASLSPELSTWLCPTGLSYEEIRIIQCVGERRERPMPAFLLRLLMSLTLPLLFEYGYQQI